MEHLEEQKLSCVCWKKRTKKAERLWLFRTWKQLTKSMKEVKPQGVARSFRGSVVGSILYSPLFCLPAARAAAASDCLLLPASDSATPQQPSFLFRILAGDLEEGAHCQRTLLFSEDSRRIPLNLELY